MACCTPVSARKRGVETPEPLVALLPIATLHAFMASMKNHVTILEVEKRPYPSSHNHEVENYHNFEETNLGGTHFPLPWLCKKEWEIGWVSIRTIFDFHVCCPVQGRNVSSLVIDWEHGHFATRSTPVPKTNMDFVHATKLLRKQWLQHADGDWQQRRHQKN